MARLSYNGVIINKHRKLFDFLNLTGGGWKPYEHNPHYEGAINNGLRRHAKYGDNVVIVGGGLGTSTVIAARQVGDAGSVTIFEGSEEMVYNVRSAARMNDVADIVDVRHAVVSEAVSVRGESSCSTIIKPDELPDCDVLELDCEGAEISILNEMIVRPRAIIVETHGIHDAPTAAVKETLTDIEYSIESEEPAEQWQPAERFCEENGIDVLTAVDDEQI